MSTDDDFLRCLAGSGPMLDLRLEALRKITRLSAALAVSEAERERKDNALREIINRDKRFDANCTSQDTGEDGPCGKIARAAVASAPAKLVPTKDQRGKCPGCDRFFDPPIDQCPTCALPLKFPYVQAAPAKPAPERDDRIMYICSECADEYPENCGHFDRNELRVMPDGRWLCDGCFDDVRRSDDPEWRELPSPPAYAPAKPAQPAQPARDDVLAVADAIDAARYKHPDYPRERPHPFAENSRSDREYAFRLARAAIRAISTLKRKP